MPETQTRMGGATQRARIVERETGLPIEDAVERSAKHLLSLQAADGYWWGELEADTTLECDHILLHYILGDSENEKVRKLANYVRRKQLDDGGWNIYPGGPAELNTSVKAYFALKLAGDAPRAAHMERARAKIHELGGLEATNSYVRFYFAMVGAIGWNMVPAIPPELLLLPNWFFVNLYDMSSWTRAIVVPLTIIYARKPGWKIPESARVDELFANAENKTASFRWSRKVFSWRNLFLVIDQVLKVHEGLPWKPFRRWALTQAERWILEHMERSEGLATIYPAMANSVFAMLAMGYPANDPLVARELGWISGYEIEEDETLRMQPCISPVWDTAIAMVSLEEAGVDRSHPALQSAARWLLDHQILGPGDWQVKNRDAAPGGWAFEFRNDFYPDVDDTAFVLMALQNVSYSDPERFEQGARRGIAWLLSMQNRDGGWGAFDRDNDHVLLTQIPFADHNAMIDPSSADVTARSIECLGKFGWTASHPTIRRAVSYLEREQTAEGAWYGRWGSNYVYGTSGVLRAAEALSLTESRESRRAADWLRRVQNADGGFGETCASYNDPSLKGIGESTASQTAWGLIGLLATERPDDAAVQRAVAWLVGHQNEDGSWDEDQFTGTGFPCVFYLKYHLYRNSFPLYALARYRNLTKEHQTEMGVLQFNPNEFTHRNGHGGKR
ncbi:MAG: squalene--hopene cyclase [Candidatus Acidiferrales bacterium]